MAVERHVLVTEGALPDLDAALAWVVRHYDKELSEASLVKLVIEQSYVIDDEHEDGRFEWTAAVSGMTEEDE